MLSDPRCGQVHTEGQIAACSNAATPESAVLSSPRRPLVIPRSCHMEAFLCQLVWSNSVCSCGMALAWIWSLDLVFPCCYQENGEELLRKEKKQTALHAKLRVALPFQEKGGRWKHAEALKPFSSPGWDLGNQVLNLTVWGKREFKWCIPSTEIMIKVGSYMKTCFLCTRISLNMTAKTRDNNSSHFVSDVVNWEQLSLALHFIEGHCGHESLFWATQLFPGSVTIWTTFLTHPHLTSNDNKLWGTIQGNKKQKWKDVNSMEHTKKNGWDARFLKLCINFISPLQIIPHERKRVSSYIPPLCSFSSASLWNQISGAFAWRTVIFYMFLKHKVELLKWCSTGLAAQKINRWLQNIWKKGITMQTYTNLCSNDSA